MAPEPDIDLEPVAPPAENGNGSAEAPQDLWLLDKNGRQYVKRPKGRSGIIIRQGDETIAQALERDAKPRDQRPRKPRRPKMPEGTRKIDLKELEKALADALQAPAMLAASFGDEWGAEHFRVSGPYLARNLVNASEHNPWLRKKLEDAATGQDAMMKVVTLVGVGGAVFGYAVPPIVYYLNLPAPDKAREMFGIPPRREREPPYATTSPPAEPTDLAA